MRSLNTPKNVLLSLYYSLFHSHMSYGICLYGSADDQYLSKIVLIQKRAIRLLSKAPFNAHTAPLFKNLGILNFSNTLKLQLSMLMWQYDHGELPACFNDYFKKVNSIHTYNTRSSSSTKLSVDFLASTDKYGKNMLQFIGPRFFNEIITLDFYKRCNSKIGFKSCMKKHLLSD